MDTPGALIVVLVVGAGLGLLAGWLLGRRARGGEDPQVVALRHGSELAQLRADADAAAARAEREHLTQRAQEGAIAAGAHARLQTELAGSLARAEALEGEIAAQERRHRDLAERHQREQIEQRQRDAAESRVLQALTPVQEQLRTMQTKVAEIETQRALQHGELAQQLRAAVESEERLRSTAETLASALRSNSTRGVWGETQLRSVVEAAGLIERVDFDVQSSILSDAGAGRPDMVVRLPGGKSIAVDAKVPFTAYLEAAAIPHTAGDAETARRAELMRAHAKAVRDHITTLGSKAYWGGLAASPELVIAFIPSESLVSSALEADPALMEFAFGKRVALASPVTLWSVLKTVAFSWQQDVVTQEAKTLFDLSRELYGRLATMSAHIAKLGRSLEGGVKAYNAFVGSLERQVLPSARRLTALDESKLLPPLEEVEELPRAATAFELQSADGSSADDAQAPPTTVPPAIAPAGDRGAPASAR